MTTTDPGAIDLEVYKQFRAVLPLERVDELIAAVEALRERVAELEAEKRAPVQGYSAGIPWSMHLRAYDVYCKRFSPQPALINLEKRNCRGGFGTEELDEFIPGWRDELSKTAQLLRRSEAAEARVVALEGARVVEKMEITLEKVKQACLFTDDDAGEIGVTTDPHIPSELFAEICAVLQPLTSLQVTETKLTGVLTLKG